MSSFKVKLMIEGEEVTIEEVCDFMNNKHLSHKDHLYADQLITSLNNSKEQPPFFKNFIEELEKIKTRINRKQTSLPVSLTGFNRVVTNRSVLQ